MNTAPLASLTRGTEMLLIECPWCGQRDESEFSYAGEAHIARPLETEKLSDENVHA